MEQEFLLTYHGKVSSERFMGMFGEERAWMLNRLQEEVERQNEANEKASNG